MSVSASHPFGCLCCHRRLRAPGLLCWTCRKPEPDREPTTEWRRLRMAARARGEDPNAVAVAAEGEASDA